MSRPVSWGKDLAKSAKVDNHRAGENAKAALRETLILALGGPERCHVLELFAGSGVMYRHVWHKAASHGACDIRWFRDERRAWVVDNRRLLRALDLGPFNLFDLDAYGSPWTQATIIAARRRLVPGERVGLVWTDGAAMKAKMGTFSFDMAQLAGLEIRLHGGHANAIYVDSMMRAVREMARRMGGAVVDAWLVKRRDVYYGAAVLAEDGPGIPGEDGPEGPGEWP